MIQTADVSVFLGAVVQPKTKEPVWVRRKFDTYRTIEIFRGFNYQVVVGEGYLDGGDMGQEYLNSQVITGFPRAHTPQGIRREFRGDGFGTCLYTGLVLIASAIAEGALASSMLGRMPGNGYGICSDEESRSHEATAWWAAAVQRGLAQQQEGECSYECEGGDDETEQLDDEDLSDYMSQRSWLNIRSAIIDAVEQYSEWSIKNLNSIRGDVERTVESSSGGMMTADYYTLTSAEKHKLVAVREVFQGRFDQWMKSPTLEGNYDKDVILALNVARQPPFAVGKLVECARHMGATESEVTAMVMRNRFGVDLLENALGTSTPEEMRIGADMDPGAGVMMRQNPRGRRRRRRAVPMHEPRPAEPVRNPTPSSSDRREIERGLDKLERLRDDLGWNDLEDLP